MAVNIKLGDIGKQLIADVGKIQEDQEKAFKRAVKDSVDAIYNGAIVNLMLRFQGGNHPHANELLNLMYFKQLDYSKDKDSITSSWEIGNTFQWAAALEYGTRAHDIKAKGDKPLVFETEIFQPYNNWLKEPVIGRDGGYLKITYSVKHPGAKPALFLSHAILDNINVFERSFSKYSK